MKTVYFAESWFNPEQQAFRKAGTEAIQKNPTVDWDNSYVPIDHQYKGLTINDDPDLLMNKEWQQATFSGDIQGMQNSDMIVALYDPKMENSDPGVVWELGYTFALRKPVYVVLPDGADVELNLMPAMGATRIIRLSELATFDFNKGVYGIYDGLVY